MCCRRAHTARRPSRLGRGTAGRALGRRIAVYARDERGVALVMAMVVTLILALLVAGIAQQMVAELGMGQFTRQDAVALYLAQAGIEHQLYLQKVNKDAGAIAYTNYPSTDQTRWYATSLTCLLNCSGNPSARRWRIRSTGEIRRYNPDTTFLVLQTRVLVAEVDITYDGIAPSLYLYPLKVTVYRWEEEVP